MVARHLKDYVPVCLSWITAIALFFLIGGCARGVLDPDIVDELRHPTKFPDIYVPKVFEVDKLLAEYPLEEVEKVKVVPMADTKYSTVQMMIVKQGVEVPTHYHKDHDEVVYIKKGKGIIILDGTRYYVEEGMVVLIPRRVRHKFVNTGEGVSVAFSVFFPPHTGEDIKFIKEKRRKPYKEDAGPKIGITPSSPGGGHSH
jgi:mannose-6-phosphate isomerase-like protein (cupin superfamily)